MSLLTPLYMLGLAAITLPILFHLIRRTPRGRQAFSSLMFLSESPPKLTRRSRLDNLLLLLLRALAFSLLAVAFARPFMREAALLTLEDTRVRRIAIVLDKSASMRRAGLWERAKHEVLQILNDLEPGDDVALFTFDDQVTTAVDFPQPQEVQSSTNAERIRAQLVESSPSWGGSRLGLAILTAADALGVANDLNQSDAAMQIVLISDLQQGAQFDSLHAYEWPSDVALDARRIAPDNPSNAFVRVLSDESQALQGELRVKVSNSGDSAVDQFSLGWEGEPEEDSLAVYVPPGQNRVVRLARTQKDAPAARLVLRGDSAPFDNSFHVVPVAKQQLTVGYVGSDDPDDPEGLRYYLELAMADTFRRQVEVYSSEPGAPLEMAVNGIPDMVVITRSLTAAGFQEVKQYLAAGGCVLAVVKDRDAAVQLAGFDERIGLEDADDRAIGADYVMLDEINFSHPLFAAFAKPQYNDFTKIHFWRHVRLDLPDNTGKIVARFDDGSPAIWETGIGEGRLLVMTSGWDPQDSQLALSTKFVPLISGILDQASGVAEILPSYTVHQRITLPESAQDGDTVHTPDGSQIRLAAGDSTLDATETPGVYRVASGDRETKFAVNLSAAESETSLLDLEQLEQLGVRLGTQATQSEELARQRQLRDIELEGRQKMWRWLVVAALGVLGIETVLAGWQVRRSQRIATRE